MSAVTVVATVEASNEPPRVKLGVTDTGSPNLFAATVTRLNPDGSVVAVRTSDGGPLVLSTSGSNRVGTVYDYEMPLGAPVTYSTAESPGSTTGEVTVSSSRVWLNHVGIPELSVPIEFRIDSFDQEEWGVQESVLRPMGRRFPVIRTDGTRWAPESSFTVAVESLAELAALRAVLADAGTLLLNVPLTMNLGVDTCYIAVGSVRNARPSNIGTEQLRAVTLPYRVVDRPTGGSQAERTLADLLVYATLGDIGDAYPTLADVLAGP